MGVEQRITENFDLWTSAIRVKATQGRGGSKKLELYGIKKLRELILDLAVRGKLIPQDKSDEPACVLLERITADKAQLVKEKKIKKPKNFPEIGDDEIPFILPQGWEWARLGVVCKKVTDGSHNPPRDSGFGYPMLSSQNVNFDEIDFSSPSRFVTEEDFIKEDKRTSIKPMDVLLNIVASIGRSAVVPLNAPKFVVQRSVAVLDSLLDQNFFAKMLVAPLCTNYYSTHAKGTAQKGIYLGQLSLMPLAIPPIEEQHRIVAKIDELIALCDHLEQQTEACFDAHQRLVDTLLDSLTIAKDASELSENWARLSEHFDTFITTDYAIEKLKQTILKLAIMGKLVPQDPTDEPASQLLQRIATEKEQLIKDKKIKKQQPLPAITEEEKPFGLPEGWEYCRLDDICYGITSGSTPPKSEFHEDEGVPYLKVYNIRDQLIDFEYKPQFVQPEYHSTKLKRSVLYPGDVVMNIVGPPLGKVAIIPETHPEWNCNQAITFFRPINSKLNTYIYTYLKAGTFLNSIELIGTAGQDNISVTKSRSIILPTPPIDEQYRIIAKVDELMYLCDRLKTRLRRAQDTQLHLADAVLYEVIGEPEKNIEDAEVNTQIMRITTILSLNHEEFGADTIIAPILLELGGSADAKDVWSKTKLSLPEFYAQLKIEIDAEYIAKPARANF